MREDALATNPAAADVPRMCSLAVNSRFQTASQPVNSESVTTSLEDRDNTGSHLEAVYDSVQRQPIRLHSSIHDDQPCECLSCRNLRAAIQRHAKAQPMPLPRR